MNIYLVSQKKNQGYDTYDRFVIACSNKEEARQTDPNGNKMVSENEKWGYYQKRNEGDAFWHDANEDEWTTPEYVSVEEIGEAAEGIEGIICTSYHAG